jgi:hypothetical protein
MSISLELKQLIRHLIRFYDLSYTYQNIVYIIVENFAKKFLSFQELQVSLAGQTVGNGIVVDVSKYFTKIVAFDPIKKR